jgi:hypothetical protein
LNFNILFFILSLNNIHLRTSSSLLPSSLISLPLSLAQLSYPLSSST